MRFGVGITIIFSFLYLFLLCLSAQAATLKAENQLLSAQTMAVPGSTIQLAIQQKLPAGWHTYARDPGDIGQPLTLQWQSPADWQIGAFNWPPPETITTPPNFTSHIYKNELLLPFTAQIPQNTALGSIILKTKIDYLICAETCIPETARLALPLQIGTTAVASNDAAIIQRTSPAPSIIPWWVVIGTALLAGLFMNLMPCVLPLLLIKTTGLLHTKNTKLALLAYLAGLFASLYTMLAAVYVARTILHTGFGFEFLWQSKIFIKILIGIILISAIWVIRGTQIIRFQLLQTLQHPYLDYFITGAVGMALALPCTGPLLGPVLFTAFSQTLRYSFLIFTGLGLGYALPVILLLLVPRWRAIIPKPGPWLYYMRYITAAILLALAVWLSFLLPVAPHLKPVTTIATVADIETAIAVHGNVFVDITADWCLTCKFNEWHVLDTPAAQTLFSANHVKTMRLDWTDRSAEIAAFLASHQRAGVPLYIWYHHGQPTILPQILTLSDLQNQLPRQ